MTASDLTLDIVRSKSEYIYERISKCDDTGCWNWTGAISDKGYGKLKIKMPCGRIYQARANRIAFMLFNDVLLDKSLEVCHKCDNRKCINPSHLFSADHRQNMLDAVAKERLFRKLSDDDVRTVRSLIYDGHSVSDIAMKFGVSITLIECIRSGKRRSLVR